MRKRTDQLVIGDRVLLVGRHVRTVSEVRESSWLNHRNQPILYVFYAEGSTADWSHGNSGIASSEWEIAP